MFYLALALYAARIPAIFSSQTAPVSPGATIPFELMPSGHIAVMAKLNGLGPFRLGFDTGSPITFVNRKTGAKVGLIKTPANPSHSILPAGQTNVNSFALGFATAHDLNVMVMDHPVVELIGEVEGGLNGLVGFSYFARYSTTIDYVKKTLTFADNGYKPDEVIASVMKRYIKNTSGGGTINTGAIWGLTLEDTSDHHGMRVIRVSHPGPCSGKLIVGDKILTIDGRWTDTLRDTWIALSEIAPDRPVSLKVKRNGKTLNLNITPVAGI